MEWQPATVAEVKKILEADLANCDQKQAALFEIYSVDPYLAPIFRHDKNEQVVVVARKGNEVIYWEDIEEGFEVSRLGTEGQILDLGANQWDLGLASNQWM